MTMRRHILVSLVAGAFLSLPSFAQTSIPVNFDLNYPGGDKLESMSVKQGNALPLDSKPIPERDGYRFAGWFTSPDCNPSEEWLFGNNSVGFFGQATDSMAVRRPMTLYAKWVEPTPIRTPEDLDAMRNDLSGWYILENDIDLSGIANWIPVGEYEGPYEWAPGEWWKKAFKGKFEGNGHKIKNLHITKLVTDKSGLFGACVNAELIGVKMENTVIELTAERPYVAPLAGILKQDGGRKAEISGCSITGTVIKVKTTNKESTFHSFTGLCGGAWNGTIAYNDVSGKMDIEIAGEGGGELYVGAFLGEAYNDTIGCISDMDINIKFSKQTKNDFKAYIGGLQASATNIDYCQASGSINLSGISGSKEIYIGGVAGSERYGTIKSTKSSVHITEKGLPSVTIGGIIGEFNSTFAMMGAAMGTTTTTLNYCTFNGKIDYDRNGTEQFGEICGTGQPQQAPSQWGPSMNYVIKNCKYEPAE